MIQSKFGLSTKLFVQTGTKHSTLLLKEVANNEINELSVKLFPPQQSQQDCLKLFSSDLFCIVQNFIRSGQTKKELSDYIYLLSNRTIENWLNARYITLTSKSRAKHMLLDSKYPLFNRKVFIISLLIIDFLNKGNKKHFLTKLIKQNIGSIEILQIIINQIIHELNCSFISTNSFNLNELKHPTLYRGINAPLTLLVKQNETGNFYIEDEAFSSFSTNLSIAEKYARNQVILRIYPNKENNARYVDLTKASVFKKEEEVLIEPARYILLNIEPEILTDKDGISYGCYDVRVEKIRA